MKYQAPDYQWIVHLTKDAEGNFIKELWEVPFLPIYDTTATGYYMVTGPDSEWTVEKGTRDLNPPVTVPYSDSVAAGLDATSGATVNPANLSMYLPSKNLSTPWVQPDPDVILTGDLNEDRIENYPKTKVTLYKKDADTGNSLDGAKFTLYTDTLNFYGMDLESASQITDHEGKLTFTDLEEGTYYLRETSPPKGYSSLGQDYAIQIVVTEDKDTPKKLNVTYREGTLQSQGRLDYVFENGVVVFNPLTDTTKAKVTNVTPDPAPMASLELAVKNELLTLQLRKVFPQILGNQDIRVGTLKLKVSPTEGITLPEGAVTEFEFKLEKDASGQYQPLEIRIPADWPSGPYSIRLCNALGSLRYLPDGYVQRRRI